MNGGKYAERLASYAERLQAEATSCGFFRSLWAKFTAVWNMIARLPLPQRLQPASASLPTPDALALMPLAGALMGFIATLPAALLALRLPPAASAWIGCALYICVGWSLHLDGWGDLWDGVGSGRRGEAMRAVMKDSRTGAYGVAGIVLAIGTRAALLGAVPVAFWLPAAAVAGGVGRFACTAAAFRGAYPWSAGMGRDIVHGFRGYQLFCTFLLSCPLLILAPAGWTLALPCSALVGGLLAEWANRRLGGTNGDVLGAAAVLGEIISFCCLAL